MIFILKGATFPSTIGTVEGGVKQYIGQVGSGGATYYTITYKYVNESGVTIKTDTTAQKAEGTVLTFATSGAPYISGYEAKSVSPASLTVTGDATVTYTYKVSENTGGEPETPVNPTPGENVPLTFYDHSNGNDWYVMYSKNDEAAGTTIRYGLNTSNSEKAKNYVCALEDGATYSITFKNNTTGAYRCRMVTFAQPFANITKSALSVDANTGTTTTNVIYYDRDNTVSEYTTTFTNTLNHKTLAMTLGWAAKAKGNVDIDVTVTKIGEGTPETDDGELITGLYTAKDFFLKTGTDSTGAAITVPVSSNTNKARNFICELEDGATYTYSYTNGGATSTYRAVIATFAPTMNNIKIAPLGNTVSGINASTVSGAVKVLHEVEKETEGTYTGTFTNTENAKTLIMFVGWDTSNITASVKKIS